MTITYFMNNKQDEVRFKYSQVEEQAFGTKTVA